jgi:hypothetical protein
MFEIQRGLFSRRLSGTLRTGNPAKAHLYRVFVPGLAGYRYSGIELWHRYDR